MGPIDYQSMLTQLDVSPLLQMQQVRQQMQQTAEAAVQAATAAATPATDSAADKKPRSRKPAAKN